MKVFIVTEGEYSDYTIVKCCATKERAEQFMVDQILEDYNSYGHTATIYSQGVEREVPVSFPEYKERRSNHFEIEEYDLLE